MEIIICCLSCILCFVCGVWAAKGGALPPVRRQRRQEMYSRPEADDALSRDIAAMLAYTIPGKEVREHEEKDTDL